MKRIPKGLKNGHASGIWSYGQHKKSPDEIAPPARPISLPKLEFLERDLLKEPSFRDSK
jgi:hypothetical protein